MLVEVRLRRGAAAGAALESVGARKQARLRRLAAEYRAGLAQQPECMRIDVVAVSLDRGGRLRELLVVQNAIEDQ